MDLPGQILLKARSHDKLERIGETHRVTPSTIDTNSGQMSFCGRHVCVVFTLNRSFYSTSVHPVSVLILHPREMCVCFSAFLSLSFCSCCSLYPRCVERWGLYTKSACLCFVVHCQWLLRACYVLGCEEVPGTVDSTHVSVFVFRRMVTV